MKSNVEILEEMINSLPPTLNLIKDALLSQVTKIKEEIEELKEHSISWTVGDFESAAINSFENYQDGNPNTKLVVWEDMYDRTTFQAALEAMIAGHDANDGITWITVESYLDSESKIKIGYDGPGVYSKDSGEFMCRHGVINPYFVYIIDEAQYNYEFNLSKDGKSDSNSLEK